VAGAAIVFPYDKQNAKSEQVMCWVGNLGGLPGLRPTLLLSRTPCARSPTLPSLADDLFCREEKGVEAVMVTLPRRC